MEDRDISTPAGVARIKLREGKEGSTVNRIKKLRQRISCSFHKLSLSKEGTIPECDPEIDELLLGGGGIGGMCERQGSTGSAGAESTSSPVFYSLNGTPDRRPVPHHLLMVRSLGHSLDDPFEPSPPGGSRRSTEVGRPPGAPGSGGPACVPVAANRQIVSVLANEHAAVKRYNSTGDMIVTPAQNSTPPSSMGSYSVRRRHLRPKSEGSFNDGIRSRRASSFGYNSPFGKIDAYEKQEQLGEGSYAIVYKGLSLLTNRTVALKEIRLQSEEGTPFTAIREASLLKGLKHANIVTLHDIIHTKTTLTFVFEFMHTDLGQYLEKHIYGLQPQNVQLFMFQLLRGLSFCHQRRILHRDLKPQNLLLSEIGELKLADFGLARAKSVPSRTYSHEVVTLWYRPPDVLLGSTDYTTSLDMWGVGCIFSEMISGAALFPGMKDTWDQLDRIWKVMGTPTEEIWEGVTSMIHFCPDKFGKYSAQKLADAVPKLSSIPYAEDLLTQCLKLLPKQRISAVQALRHKYLSNLPSKLLELSESKYYKKQQHAFYRHFPSKTEVSKFRQACPQKDYKHVGYMANILMPDALPDASSSLTSSLQDIKSETCSIFSVPGVCLVPEQDDLKMTSSMVSMGSCGTQTTSIASTGRPFQGSGSSSSSKHKNSVINKAQTTSSKPCLL